MPTKARPFPFQQLFDLPIGGEMVIWPNEGETPKAALKRLKLRVSKYRSEGRSFRMKIDGKAICAQRTEFGLNTEMADWFMMQAGDRLLLKSRPAAADVKKATNAANYLNHIKPHRVWERGNKDAPYGHWFTGLDEDGRLVAECILDLAGGYVSQRPGPHAPLRHLWKGEWP